MTSSSWTARLVCAGLIGCVLDGAIRKWALYDAPYSVQALPYFAKDACLVAAAVVGAQSGRPALVLRSFRSLLYFSLVVVAAGILPTLGEIQPLGGLASLRTMIVYPLLAILIARGLRSQRDIMLIVKTVGWLAVLNAVIGSAQFYLPASSFLNQQIAADVAAHSVGLEGSIVRVRATGTFSFITGMGDMAIAGAWAGCLLLLLRPHTTLGYFFLGSGFICSLAAMSRFGLVLAFAVTMGALIGSFRRVGLVAGWALGAAAVCGLSIMLGQADQKTNLLEAVFTRHESSDSFGQRASYQVQVLMAIDEFPIGRGLGSTQAVQKASGVDLSTVSRYETELARVVVEIGFLGVVGVVLSRLVFLYQFWVGRQAGPGNVPLRFTGCVCWASFWAAAVFFLHGPSFNHISSTFVCGISAAALGAIGSKTAPGRSPQATSRRSVQPGDWQRGLA